MEAIAQLFKAVIIMVAVAILLKALLQMHAVLF